MNLKEISHCHKNWDKYRIPLKPNADGGDCLHRTGLQAIEWYLKTKEGSRGRRVAKEAFGDQLRLFYKGEGNFCRYPFATPLGDWWAGEKVFSRDQSIPVIVACGLFGMVWWVDEIYKGLKARDGWFTNRVVNGQPGTDKTPDPATPAIWGLLDRAKGFREPTGSIKTGDIQELADTKVVCATTSPPKIWLPWPAKRWHYPMGGPKLHGDPVNKTIILLFSKLTYETRNGQLARQQYAKKGRVWESWQKYWVRPGDPQCPFHEVFEPYIHALGKDELL